MAGKMVTGKGDSYIVDIIPPSKSTPYPAIYVCRRRKRHIWGTVAEEPGTGRFLNIRREQFKNDLDEIARVIGRSILDNSDIIKKYI
ncbi:MAG: hypothetical protein ABSF74_08920 [Dehalococcoidia bacterium]|jgi:hypothetical protein